MCAYVLLYVQYLSFTFYYLFVLLIIVTCLPFFLSPYHLVINQSYLLFYIHLTSEITSSISPFVITYLIGPYLYHLYYLLFIRLSIHHRSIYLSANQFLSIIQIHLTSERTRSASPQKSLSSFRFTHLSLPSETIFKIDSITGKCSLSHHRWIYLVYS